ncbi:adenine phosphoribosyltransferase [Candidatus Micrarchaeota archaeon]|nr:adenine phosphoribosyltransferase [Candidatus Micrarchaeota archaeon]
MNDLKEKIRNIPDFPKKGIMFRDITTLLQDKESFRQVVDGLSNQLKEKEIKFDKIVSAESRGFIFGGILAYKFNAGFVPVRKPGKLPAPKIKQEFETEYSVDAFEIHKDAIKENEKILICDDLLATAGTSLAAIKLIEKLGGKVQGCVFLIELSFLNGREKLKEYDVFSLIQYDK